MSLTAADLKSRTEEGAELSTLAWRFERPVTCVSTASVGGGVSAPAWIINAQVRHGYRRTDLADNAHEIAMTLGLTGSGVCMLTAVDVARQETATVDGVTVTATVGVSDPVWAADLAAELSDDRSPVPGTINVVVQLPVAATPAALVNLVATVTEAKCQALSAFRLPGTGTPSDAVAIVCPAGDVGEPEPFGGPRSVLGGRAARAAYLAITAGLRRGNDGLVSPC